MVVVFILLGFIIACVVASALLFSSSRETTAVVMSVCGNSNDVEKVKGICSLKNYDLVIYDKCNDCREIENCSILPNVGREQGTWLTYVIENYNKLPDKILFLPAPIDKYNRLNRGMFMLDTKLHIGDSIGPHENFTLDVWNDTPLIPAETRPFRAWYEKNIGQWDPSRGDAYWNGVMATTRQRILQKSREFYMNLHRQVAIDTNTEVGHYLERSMGSIF
jgi:hypothetical protein